ncbi:Uncharacterized protein FKW44_002969 [Caligus rogercresseyi]|uniref:Uncharacterized protein n=1 Tax=Caligus rogercresseyi TaxID=217165 RepID=A0A7T8KKY2_CALRO|nr:Uncharacterized protein FKW44_002969 [Caligus rogercresseyi]
MPPYWFPKGLQVGAKEYLEVIRDIAKPWMDATYLMAITVSNRMESRGTQLNLCNSGVRRI